MHIQRYNFCSPRQEWQAIEDNVINHYENVLQVTAIIEQKRNTSLLLVNIQILRYEHKIPSCTIRNSVSVPQAYSQQATSFHHLRSRCTIHSNGYRVLQSACCADKYSAVSFGAKISTQLQHETLLSHYLAFSALFQINQDMFLCKFTTPMQLAHSTLNMIPIQDF